MRAVRRLNRLRLFLTRNLRALPPTKRYANRREELMRSFITILGKYFLHTIYDERDVLCCGGLRANCLIIPNDDGLFFFQLSRVAAARHGGSC